MVTKVFKTTIIISFLLLVSCKENKNVEVSKKTYSYEILDKDSNVKGFFKRIISVNGNERTDTIFRLSVQKKHLDTVVENYIIDNYGLINKETNEYYINIQKKDSCYKYLDTGEQYELCFLGKENLKINNKEYNSVYTYKITQLREDGVQRYLYFDNDFILLKDVYKYGYAPYFDIELLDK